MLPRALGGSWDLGYAVGVGMGKEVVVVEESAGGDRRCTLKFYLSNLCVGNGNGRPELPGQQVHSKSNNRTVSVSQRKRDINARHTNPVIT